jgi:hypothetical protein
VVILEIGIGEPLAVGVANDKTGGLLVDGPGRREAAGGHGVVFFDAVGGCSQWGHYFRANLLRIGGRMRIFSYLGISFLIVCILAGTKALSVDTASMVIDVADMAQVVAPDTTQSQNQTDSALERLQDLAEEQEDLLNIRD